jgi:hypothetical protein
MTFLPWPPKDSKDEVLHWNGVHTLKKVAGLIERYGVVI